MYLFLFIDLFIYLFIYNIYIYTYTVFSKKKNVGCASPKLGSPIPETHPVPHQISRSASQNWVDGDCLGGIELGSKVVDIFHYINIALNWDICYIAIYGFV